jgi:hypothetical protein
MMFLIRVGFWLSIVVLLLPTTRAPDAKVPEIGAVDAISAASAAVSDMRQFCIRQPEACVVGSQAATAFGQKAQAGAKMIYDFLSEKTGQEKTTPASPQPAPASPQPAQASVEAVDKRSQNTLTPADRTPTWRAPRQDGKRPA